MSPRLVFEEHGIEQESDGASDVSVEIDMKPYESDGASDVSVETDDDMNH